MPTDEVLDLAHGPSPGCPEPLLLGGRYRDASELAREREADGSGLQVARDFGQLLERFGDAKLFLREPRAIAEQSLGVFLKRRVTEAQMRSGSVRSEQPTPLLEIEPRPLRSESNELFVCLTPRDVFEFQNDCRCHANLPTTRRSGARVSPPL
jgi:hypothetical protein